MSEDLRITFVPGAPDSLTLHVEYPQLPAAGRYFQRPMLQVTADEIERFRRGDLSAAEVDDLIARVNDWLFAPDLRQLIAGFLGVGNGQRLRVVFVIPDERRDQVTNLPLELLWHDTPTRPLVLRQDVEGLVYLLSKPKPAHATRTSATWPFKVLIVRPNPPDLGGTVPPVLPLRQHVLANAALYGNGNLQVDVLSGEPGIDKAATWNALQDHLKHTSDYNVLVYLGHGELVQSAGQSIGQLFFDSVDGNGHQPISAPMIARLLSKYPIPVVVLAGCLTAAQGMAPVKRLGGEEGVAQTLVNSSEAGVQIAVGMRIELESSAAIRFLKAFFSSLLDQHDGAGNIDRAVWQGRNELFLSSGLFPPHWAAPVVFRTPATEPFIEFLTKPTGFPLTREMQKLLEIRTALWAPLPEQSLAQGTPLLNAVKAPLLTVEQSLKAEGLKQGPLLLPCHNMIGAGEERDTPIDVVGALSVSRLRGRAVITGDGVTITGVTAAPALRGAGFRLLTDENDPPFFEIRSQSGTPKPLPEGHVLTLSVAVAATTAPALFPLALQIDEVAPQTALWAGDNVIAVPKP